MCVCFFSLITDHWLLITDSEKGKPVGQGKTGTGGAQETILNGDQPLSLELIQEGSSFGGEVPAVSGGEIAKVNPCLLPKTQEQGLETKLIEGEEFSFLYGKAVCSEFRCVPVERSKFHHR